ncbi:MAG TPA: PKD domain-containing protein, partial [Bacteroidia bacterium]|nr:PKD domain-containing protein [Bacteroidia bacterium]
VTSIDSNGCKAAPVDVTVQVITPLSVSTNAALAGVCVGGKDSLKSVVTGGSAPYTYSWTPTTGLSNSTSSKVNATINTTTTYTLTVKDACGTATDTLTVGVYPSPVINFTTNKKSGCTPVCIHFMDSSSISSGSIVHWEWNFGNGQTSTSRDTTYCYTTTGSYNIGLQETSDKGCVSTYNGLYTITANPLPVANFSYSPNTTNILQPTISFTDLSVGAVSWQWNFGDPLATELGADTSNLQNPTHTYQDTGRFCITLTVMNADSCFASNEYCLVIQPDWAIYVPNAFTPNGDGLNDVFIAKGFGLDPDGFKMYIFDRWGNLIFNTNNINQGWDGHANKGAKIAQEDVYVWKIIVKDVFGSTHQYIGKVTLVR